jgi:filamentous hemagglutinin
MIQKTIELASIDQAQELVVAEGTIATYDAAQGPLLVASFVNHGTLRITSSNPALQEAEIAADSLTNFGDIQCDLDQLTIKSAKIRGLNKGGRFIARQTILLKSDGDMKANGGIFQADLLQIVAGGKVGVHAYRIDAKVKVKAKEVAVGANDGNLEIVEQEIDGDPLYYQGKDTNGGNMTITVMNQPGEDVSLWAVGNITVNGAINTLGGDAQHPGRITIQGGCQKVAYNDVENDGRVECIDCALPFPGLEVITTPLASNTSVITLGNLSGKAVNVIGGTIITADVVVDNENNPDAGQCSFTAATSVKVGNITTTRRDGAGVRKGGMNAFAKDIDIGNVDGAVLLLSDQSGLIKVGNVSADFGAIQIKAGQDFGGGGGGLVGGAAIASFTTLNANIQTGTLKSQSSILLMANGTIGTGTITLDPNPFSGPSSPSIPHDVRVHANINKETSPAFLAGGGGTNGTGQITINNRAYVSQDQKSGVIAITNGPNGDVHVNGTRLKCLTGDKGTPGIVVDAGSGQVRMVGGSPLSVDGSASQDAGFVVLQGGELRAPNAAVISASDTKGSAEDEAPIVLLAVDKITLPGSLTVNCNGNTGTSVKVAPKGSFGADIVHIDYTTPITPQGFSPVVHEVAVTGAGSLTVTANSKNGSILCSGDPLRFANNGATHIESEGDGSIIELKFAGSPSGQDSLIFTGGTVEVTADNPQHNGGTIMVTADKVKNTAPSVAMHANALADGNGGTISLDIDRGNLSLGTTTGTMSLTCTGMGTGAGGNISVENAKHNGTITLDPTFSTAALNVAALGSNGDGGHIDLHADHLVNNATGGNSGLVANGVGTGNGGHIGLRLTDSITIGGAPGLFVTAISTGSGNGGDIDIISTQGSVTIDSASLSVTAGTDGRGGKITAKTLQSGSTLTVNGSLTANGQNTKKGGDIKVLSAGILNIATAHFEAKGGPRGAGGTVELNAESDLTVEGAQVNVASGGTGSNAGGKVVISTAGEGIAAVNALQAGGNLSISGEINVSGTNAAAGGDAFIISGGSLNLSGLTVKADGGSSGNGGTISVEFAAANDVLTVKNLSAKGGSIDNVGGQIRIENHLVGGLTVNVAGKIETQAGFTLSGSTSLVTASEGNRGGIAVHSGGTLTLNGAGTLDGSVIVLVATDINVAWVSVRAWTSCSRWKCCRRLRIQSRCW